MGPAARTVRGLAISCHLGPTLAVTGLSIALAVGAGAGPAAAVLIAGAVLTGQLSVGWSNDWVDAGRDIAVGRRDKPVVAGHVTVGAVRAGALVAAALCVPLSLAAGWLGGVVHLVAVASGWGYNLGIKGTPWSWAPYALSFGLLTAFVTLSLPDQQWPPWWVVAAAALLGVGAHLANVVPDLDDDRATGIRGLPHRLGRTGASLLAPALLLGAAALIVLAPPGQPSAASLAGLVASGVIAATGAVIALRRHRSKVPFYLTMVVAAVAVVLLVGAGPTPG